MTFILALIVFSLFTGNPLFWAMIVSITVTALNFLIGDLWLLQKISNTVTFNIEAIIAALTAYAFDLMSPAFTTNVTSLVSFGALILLGEAFFHYFLIKSGQVALKKVNWKE